MSSFFSAATLVVVLALGGGAGAGQAGAAVYGSSNLGYRGYPEPDCIQPVPPYSRESWAWRAFQSELEMYKMCIQDYVEAAENDRRRVLERANEAIDDYNMFIQSLR